MTRRKIVFTDYYYPDNSQEMRILSALDGVEIVDCTKIAPGGVKVEEQVLRYAHDADALIVQFAKISRKVIEGLERCRIISRYAIGVDTIDVEAAREKGIVVSNVPDYCIEEVSDTAIAHMMNCLRRVTRAHTLLQAGEWAYDKIKPLRRFSTLTVGLVAFGHIARRVAEKIRAFGCPMLAYDPYFKEMSRYPWVEFVSLEELLRRSDLISIHAPLNDGTHHLIDRARLGQMKKGVILVNTSRSGLIDEVALAEAIENGTVQAAGLDVLEYLDEDYRKSVLTRYPDRVFITPHMGWYSEEAILDLQRKAAQNVFEMFTRGAPLYRV